MGDADSHWRKLGRRIVRLSPSQKTGREII